MKTAPLMRGSVNAINALTKEQIMRDNPHARRDYIRTLNMGIPGESTQRDFPQFTMWVTVVLNREENYASYLYDIVRNRWVIGCN